MTARNSHSTQLLLLMIVNMKLRVIRTRLIAPHMMVAVVRSILMMLSNVALLAGQQKDIQLHSSVALALLTHDCQFAIPKIVAVADERTTAATKHSTIH